MSMTATLPSPTSRRMRDTLLLGGLLAFVVIGLVGLANATGWEETRAAFLRLSIWQFIGLLALSLVNYGLRGLRWHVFTGCLRLRINLLQDLRHFFGGFAMTVTPGRVGELVRMRWIARETGASFEDTAPLVLIYRASDLAALALLLAAGLALSTTGVAGGIPVAIVALLVAVVVTRPVLAERIAEALFALVRRWPRLFAKLRRAARTLEHFSTAPVMASAIVLGLLGWLAECYAFHLLLVWMGADIGLAKATAIFVFATIAGGLTGAPGGLGGAEAAMIALLTLEGIPLEVSVPATAIIRVTTLWFAILIGLGVFPFAEKHSRKAAHALEN